MRALKPSASLNTIAASSAIPILFKPVQIRARDFVDGGVGKVAHFEINCAAPNPYKDRICRVG